MNTCTCCGHTFFGRFNQGSTVSHKHFLKSSKLIALVPTSAELLIPITCLICEFSAESRISAPRLAKKPAVYECGSVSTALLLLGVTSNYKYVSFFHVPWFFVPSTLSLLWLPLAILLVAIRDFSLVPLLVFKLQIPKVLSIFLVESVGRPLYTFMILTKIIWKTIQLSLRTFKSEVS